MNKPDVISCVPDVIDSNQRRWSRLIYAHDIISAPYFSKSYHGMASLKTWYHFLRKFSYAGSLTAFSTSANQYYLMPRVTLTRGGNPKATAGVMKLACPTNGVILVTPALFSSFFCRAAWSVAYIFEPEISFVLCRLTWAIIPIWNYWIIYWMIPTLRRNNCEAALWTIVPALKANQPELRSFGSVGWFFAYNP